MKYFYIDIETFGNKPDEEELILPTRDDVKVGNLKDKDKIEAKINNTLPEMISEAKAKHKKDFDEKWRANALRSLDLNIIALSYAIDDNPVVNLYGEEKNILEKLESFLINMETNDLHSLHFVAHNGNEFDYPILYHRSMKYGLLRLKSIIPKARFSDKHVDTQVLFRGSAYRNYYSLNNICEFFEIEGKGDIDGSKVHDMYLNGEIKKISEYCGHDVEMLRNAHKKMIGLI